MSLEFKGTDFIGERAAQPAQGVYEFMHGRVLELEAELAALRERWDLLHKDWQNRMQEATALRNEVWAWEKTAEFYAVKAGLADRARAWCYLGPNLDGWGVREPSEEVLNKWLADYDAVQKARP